jgi:hypothetical protein
LGWVDLLYLDQLEIRTLGSPIQLGLQRSLLQQMMGELRVHSHTNTKHGNEQSLLHVQLHP